MKMRVGTLGEMDTEFVADEITRQGDHIIVTMKTSGEGTTWSAAVAADYNDIAKIIKLALKLSVISFLLFGIRSRKNPRPLEEF